MSHSIRSPLSFCSFLGVGVLVMLLGLTRLSAVPAPDREITNSIGMKLMLIPAGKFLMGSPKDEKGRSDDENQYEVEITKPFYLGMYTVTVGHFRKFVKDAGYQTEAEKDGQGGGGYNAEITDLDFGKKYNWQNTGWEQTDDHPVVNVTWNDAMAFCEWLSKKEGKKYRLPTEAEWEYSCRAGTTTRFYSGDDEETLKGVANLADASFKQKYPKAALVVKWDDGYPFTAPVGKFKPNAFGLYDMHGNVWEWCQDWYGAYPQGKVADPQGPKEGKAHVMRGGSFNYFDAGYVRAANRDREVPSNRNLDVGFRLCFSLD